MPLSDRTRQLTQAQQQRTGLWLEVLVVILFAWLPVMVDAVLTPGVFLGAEKLHALAPQVIEPPKPAFPAGGLQHYDDAKFIAETAVELAWCLQVLAPMLLLIWLRRSEFPLTTYGLVKPRLLRDLAGGLGLYIAALVVTLALVFILPNDHFIQVHLTSSPSALPGYIVLCVWLPLNSVVEELVWRGYIPQRLRFLTGSSVVAILTSAALFASYHLVFGRNSAILAFPWAIVFSAGFRWFRSLWPLIIAHTLHNIVVFGLRVLIDLPAR